MEVRAKNGKGPLLFEWWSIIIKIEFPRARRNGKIKKTQEVSTWKEIQFGRAARGAKAGG